MTRNHVTAARARVVEPNALLLFLFLLFLFLLFLTKKAVGDDGRRLLERFPFA